MPDPKTPSAEPQDPYGGQLPTIISGLAAGFTPDQVALRLGVSAALVDRALKQRTRLTPELIERQRIATWLRLLKAGHTVEFVAEVYALTPRTVRKTLQRHGLPTVEEIQHAAAMARDESLRQRLLSKPFSF